MKRYLPWLLALMFLIALAAYPQPGSRFRFRTASQPIAFDPLMVMDESSETVRLPDPRRARPAPSQNAGTRTCADFVREDHARRPHHPLHPAR